ncbi:MAG: hypothetical protein HC903_05295 [Methylacidiphilales bacterium]|nr:hypothetical protein [Candidatus Methylacidiphilales bacterium]NJR14828.1 hypothetical protein [Calothrix sp. CSU_2_0]
MKRKMWQELNDQQAEKLSGGMNKGDLVDKVSEKATVIRGTLILTLA